MSFIIKTEKDIDELIVEIDSKEILKTGLVNGLRRIMLSDIPIHCISTSKINFIKNTCMFDDEFLKHRLGLVSIKNNTLKDLDDIVLTLNKKNITDKIISVYMKDFVINQRDTTIKNENLIKFPNTLLTKLKPGQEIEVECSLDEGVGRDDARFSPVSTASYYFDYEENERDYKKDKFNYPKKYIFTIESSGQLTPKQILIKSIKILNNKLIAIKNDIIKKIGKITEFKKSPTKLNAMDIHLLNENDTVGNLLTQYIIDVDNIKYSGYHIPHPLKKLLILRFSYKDSSVETISKLVCSNIDNIISILDKLKKDCKSI